MKFENYRLSEICEIQIGKTPSRAQKEYWGKGYNWVSISDMKSEVISKTKEEITELAVKECGCKLIPEGTLLFSFKLSIGKISFAGKNLFTNEAIAALGIKNPKKITNKYLFYALKNIPLLGSNKAVMGFTLNKESLKLLKIPLPETLTDQIKIAQVLTQAEKLIAQRKESIALLDKYLKSTFLEMFGDPVRNEKGWKINSLAKFGSLKNGLNYTRDEKGISIRCLGVGDFKDLSKLTNIESLPILHLTTEPSLDYFLRDGDLVFVRSNGNRELVGRCILVFPQSVKVTFSGFCIRYRIEKDGINPIFLSHLFRVPIFRMSMLQGGRGANIQNINQKTLENLKIPIPHIELQYQFAQIVEKTEALKNQYQRSLQELEQLFGSLSQRAFKGQLDLSRMEVKEEEQQTIDKLPSPKVLKPEKIKKERPRVPAEENTVTSLWLSNRKKGKTGKIPFSPIEGNAVLHTEFSKRSKGFYFQAFEAFLKKEGFTYEYEQVKDFLFEKLELQELLQYYSNQKWMEERYRPETSPEQDDFSGDGRIWLVADKKGMP